MNLKFKNRKIVSGREFWLFLFFFLVSCSLWMMKVLQDTYETDIKIPFRVKNIPETVYAVSMEENEYITIKIKERGTTLLSYMLQNFLPVNADYSDFQKKGQGKLTFPTSALKDRIKGQLNTSTEILSISPDTIIYYTQESTRKYPVKINGKITSAIQYEIGNIEITPDSVWAFGPQAGAGDTLIAYTEPVNKTELRDSISFDIKLQSRDGIIYNPEKVKIRASVIPYSEKTFELGIKGIGFPEEYTLKAFPSKAKITFNANIQQIGSIRPEDFEVGIMYGDIHGNASEQVKLRIIKSPEAARDIRIMPKEVEYLIEYK